MVTLSGVVDIRQSSQNAATQSQVDTPIHVVEKTETEYRDNISTHDLINNAFRVSTEVFSGGMPNNTKVFMNKDDVDLAGFNP